jgi:hypothetical protein
MSHSLEEAKSNIQDGYGYNMDNDLIDIEEKEEIYKTSSSEMDDFESNPLGLDANVMNSEEVNKQLNKRNRWKPTELELAILRMTFEQNQYPSKEEKQKLLQILEVKFKSQIDMNQLNRWFQHQRERSVKSGNENIKKNTYKKFEKDELKLLEDVFAKNHYPKTDEMMQLAKNLNASLSKIENWYKHKRRSLAKRGLFKLKNKRYFKKEELQYLQEMFMLHPRPTKDAYKEIATALSCDESHIKNWYSNRRKKQKIAIRRATYKYHCNSYFRLTYDSSVKNLPPGVLLPSKVTPNYYQETPVIEDPMQIMMQHGVRYIPQPLMATIPGIPLPSQPQQIQAPQMHTIPNLAMPFIQTIPAMNPWLTPTIPQIAQNPKLQAQMKPILIQNQMQQQQQQQIPHPMQIQPQMPQGAALLTLPSGEQYILPQQSPLIPKHAPMLNYNPYMQNMQAYVVPVSHLPTTLNQTLINPLAHLSPLATPLTGQLGGQLGTHLASQLGNNLAAQQLATNLNTQAPLMSQQINPYLYANNVLPLDKQTILYNYQQPNYAQYAISQPNQAFIMPPEKVQIPPMHLPTRVPVKSMQYLQQQQHQQQQPQSSYAHNGMQLNPQAYSMLAQNPSDGLIMVNNVAGMNPLQSFYTNGANEVFVNNSTTNKTTNINNYSNVDVFNVPVMSKAASNNSNNNNNAMSDKKEM